MATDPRVVAEAAGEAVEPRVPIICLVGSSRFKHLFHAVAERLEKAGCLVLMTSFFQHADNRPVSPEERETLWRVDRKRIDLADEVVVIDGPREWCEACRMYVDHPVWTYGRRLVCCRCATPTETMTSYVGEDTKREIEYARLIGRPITYYSLRADLNGKADQTGAKDPGQADDAGTCIGTVTITADPPGPARDAGKDI